MQYENEEVDIHDETFRINDNSTLDWAFLKLSTLKTEETDIKQRAKAQYERIKNWEDAECRKFTDSINFFEHLIQDYHFRSLLEDPKAKTLSTPYGKSKSRASKASPEQADKDAVLQHVITNNMRDFIKEDLKWGDFKKTLSVAEVDGVAVVFDENGEKVPGMVVKPDSVSFSTEVT